MPGKGATTRTGSLGDVMKESVEAARTVVLSRSRLLGIKDELLDKRDIHIHVPDGATPKDGPSAGIAIASAVVSALSARPLRGDVALTGEITLRGRVLPIGGLKEKLLAAHQAGIGTVIIPESNRANLEEVPEAILGDLNVVPVSEFEEVMAVMLRDSGEDTVVPGVPERDGRDVPTPPPAA